MQIKYFKILSGTDLKITLEMVHKKDIWDNFPDPNHIF